MISYMIYEIFVLPGFSFTDSLKVVKIIMERNGITNHSISCRTTDPDATTTLFHNNQEISVGDRVTLDKQVFTIHGILLSDQGMYKCKARNSLGTIIEQLAVLISEIVNGKLSCNLEHLRPIYTTENVWHGSDKNGMRTPKPMALRHCTS